MDTYILRLRTIEPEELLSVDSVLERDATSPFLSIGDYPEPYRTYMIAFARLDPVFRNERVFQGDSRKNVCSPLIAYTPKRRGLVWRWWQSSVGIIAMRQVQGQWISEEAVTFLSADERQQVALDLTQIALNPPNWS